MRIVRLTAMFFLLAGSAALAQIGGGAAEPAGDTPAGDTPVRLLQKLDHYPHSRRVDRDESDVIDHEIGLGAIQKFSGAWSFKDSERLSGHLQRYTWQIVDGFSSEEVMRELLTEVEGMPGSELLFRCSGRSCGPAVQWANRVFHQRVLYGQQDQQHYRVYALRDAVTYRLVIYAGARTADRQYLHVDLLQVEPPPEPL